MKEQVMTPFAERVRRFRLRRGLQQQQLAEMIGVDPVVVSNIECGRMRPGLRVAARIAHALDMNADVRDLWTEPPPMRKGAKRQPKPKAAV